MDRGQALPERGRRRAGCAGRADRGGGDGVSLSVVPCTQRQAKAFVAEHHRHHRAPQGGLFALAAMDGERLCGVVIVGRPVARGLDDGRTAEVTRCCTDGTRNACSILYGRARRAARALGYSRVVTYTLPEEGGASLRAAGWQCVGEAGGGSWSCSSRPRVDHHPVQRKLRWEAA
ncbi:XF1762 family protein [Frateuria terrea]|uniref:XF1762 family protein n=1 Tax=Frateuria terrea TaxID=529704 RepID=UPI0031B5B295